MEQQIAQAAPVVRIARRSAFEPVMNKKGERVPWLFWYRPTGMAYVRRKFKKLGIPELFEPLGETTIGRAITARDIAMQRWKNRHLGIPDDHVFGQRKRGRTVAEVVDWILKEYTPKMRSKTQDHQRIYLGEIRERFGDRDVNTVVPQDLRDWVNEMKANGKLVTRGKKRVRSFRKTFSDYSKHMNLLFNKAHNELKWATHSVRFENPDPKTDEECGGRVYTKDELQSLWNLGFTAPDKEDLPKSKVPYAGLKVCRRGNDLKDQFILSYECMMRLREVLYLPWSQVNLKTGKITLYASQVKTGSKTGKGRSFIMSPGALIRLRERYRRMTADGEQPVFVFPSPRDSRRPMHDNKTAWVRAKRRAGIKGRARWHDLRHSALTEALLVKRKDPVAVSEYAGVSLATIQRVYLHSRADHTRDVAGAVQLEMEFPGGGKTVGKEASA